jgi:cation:H+ antiporter
VLIDLLMVTAGLVVLLVAGDLLVRGAVNLALRLGIPAIIVGLTIVAFGTSAPELLVSVNAVSNGAAGLAMGNVVGSNIANVLLVLGVPALISAMKVERSVARDYIMLIAATTLFIALSFVGPIGVPHALVLLAGLGLMLYDNFRRARAHKAGEGVEELEGVEPGASWLRISLYLLAGIIFLPLGAHVLVTGAVSIAQDLGVSDALIGLTLVAVGTSLPELATTVMAACRRQAGVALGAVIGSNMFNLLGIIGIAALVGPIAVPPEMLHFDLWVMLASSLLLAPFIWLRWEITRIWGVILLALYVTYVSTLVFVGT